MGAGTLSLLGSPDLPVAVVTRVSLQKQIHAKLQGQLVFRGLCIAWRED